MHLKGLGGHVPGLGYCFIVCFIEGSSYRLKGGAAIFFCRGDGNYLCDPCDCEGERDQVAATWVRVLISSVTPLLTVCVVLTGGRIYLGFGLFSE